MLSYCRSENHRDSQVSSGWHGKAITMFNKIDREEKDVEERKETAKAHLFKTLYVRCICKIPVFLKKPKKIFFFKHT